MTHAQEILLAELERLESEMPPFPYPADCQTVEERRFLRYAAAGDVAERCHDEYFFGLSPSEQEKVGRLSELYWQAARADAPTREGQGA